MIFKIYLTKNYFKRLYPQLWFIIDQWLYFVAKVVKLKWNEKTGQMIMRINVVGQSNCNIAPLFTSTQQH